MAKLGEISVLIPKKSGWKTLKRPDFIGLSGVETFENLPFLTCFIFQQLYD
jgi:hypothetical protein